MTARFAPGSRSEAAASQRLVRFTRRRSVQRYVRLLSRAARTTPGELAHRLLGRRPLFAGIADGFTLGADEMRQAWDARFLFGPRAVADLASRFRAASAAGAAHTCRAAHDLREHGFPVFGRRVALHPAPPDWQADPISGRRLWPVEPLDERTAARLATAAGADVKYAWELNRHQFLALLGCAFALEGDPRHARLAADLVTSWIAQDRPGHGVNWSSGLEVGVRALAWIWALGFLLAWDGFDDDLAGRWSRSLACHYAFLRDNLSTYADPTNHLIGEVAALWTLASVLPGLPDAARERRRSWTILTAEAERQITDDGVSREQSSGYHCFVLDFYLPVVALAQRAGDAIPPPVESRLVAMLDFLHHVLGPGGDVPHLGDGDDGRGLPYPHPVDEAGRAESLLSVGAHLFTRPAWAEGASAGTALPLWLLGRRPAPPPARAGRAPRMTTLFPRGGYVFFEAEAPDRTPLQLIFDVGGLGYLPNAAHEHADALSVVVRIGPTVLLGDPGTGSYTGAPGLRDTLRGTAAHNTVSVDGMDQADVLDAFKWLNPHATTLLAWSTSAAFDYAAAAHDGYQRLRHPVRHRREILFVRPEYWIVVDHLSGPDRHVLTQRLHFPTAVEVTAAGANAFDASVPGASARARLLFPSATAEFPVQPTLAPWSAAYGSVETAPCLVREITGRLPVTMLTVLAPGATGEVLAAATPGVHRLRFHGVDGPVDTIALEPAGADASPWLSFARRDAGGQVVRAFRAALLPRGGEGA